MGNVLWSKDAKQTTHVLETFPSESEAPNHQIELRSQVEQSGITDHCRGFVIDGDLAVQLKTYFSKDRTNNRSRSVRDIPL